MLSLKVEARKVEQLAKIILPTLLGMLIHPYVGMGLNLAFLILEWSRENKREKLTKNH